ncbi:alpha/beta hydrolase family protein [Pseudolysinimonas sp.]|jgi:dienelactone hydrolase|uniref:alpha/beta hydrolase family protein n=1 Tax=Pseudolysinimonas sp. TaxID=2680009 RepID=UPI0037850ABC
MKRLTSRNSFWLVLSLVLFVISGLGSALVQTAGGAVTMKTLTWETPDGKIHSAYLFVPNDASADDPRPAVVLSHGFNNQKQMQDNNYVELAKRGYVVLSIDRYSQGSSHVQQRTDVDTMGTGAYRGVELLASLPYVDASKIGVAGHSAGCFASNAAVTTDNANESGLVAAAYLVDCTPIVKDADGNYVNIYGSRDVGVHAAQYDEFFFRTVDPNSAQVGPAVDYSSQIAPAREWIDNAEAQAFLNFSTDESEWETRESYTTYTETIDGEEAIRRVDNPAEIHPWATFSATEAHDLVSFFDEAFGAPNPIDPSSQTWQLKAAFNGLGLVALGIFLVAFTRALLAAPVFAGLRAEITPATPISGGRQGLAWFWGALVVSAVFSGVSFIVYATGWGSTFAMYGTPGLSPQGPTSFIGVWAAINGVFTLVVMVASYYLFGKKNGQDLRQVGVFPGWRKFGLSALLAVTVVLAAVLILFISEYFFQSDWRLYVLGFTTFGADRIWIIFLYLPLYLIFYVANSIAINSFNRFTLKRREWLNTALLAVMNALPAIIIVVIQYSVFFASGEVMWGNTIGVRMAGIWLQYVIPFLIVTVFITRKIFRATNNPYIGGFIMASIATIGAVGTTYTIYG